MPSLGADMDVGTLVEWLVKPGDAVHRGDIVAVVETQKGAIEIEIFQTGTVVELLVAVDQQVPVGTPLARIRPEAGSGEETMSPGANAAAEPGQPAGATAIPEAESPSTTERSGTAELTTASRAETGGAALRILASPAARRIAQERGLDLSAFAGSGPGGAILSSDLGERPEVTRRRDVRPGLDLDAMRLAIAAAMTRSKREIPHYYLQHCIDMGRSQAWLTAANAGREPERRLLAGALFVKAVSMAVRRFPKFNGFFRTNGFEPSPAVHVGLAIAIRGGGLAAPAVHDADHLTLDELMAGIRDLVQRTRTGRMRSSEIADPTITVSSLGDRGVDALYGVIYPPQVAIVGFGKIVRRPWIVDGSVSPRPVVTVTLAADHRVSDGHDGALFLAEVETLLQEPERL
jgi:pyruvate dehydrogenase E2 component (dihydrolipoamide acetyltransferase)